MDEPKQPDPNRDTIVISRGIDRDLHYELSQALNNKKNSDKCTVYLTTRGGDANGGYRIGRCLRHHYQDVRLVVPSICKSAGTLVAIAANTLAVGDLGELGPIDVQVRKHNEMAELASGLNFTQAMEASLDHVMAAFGKALIDIRRGTRISTQLAGEFASRIAASVAAPLYAQIDPHRIGEMQRAVSIALEYGVRLDALSGAMRGLDELQRLVVGYPSHNFVIDRKEAGTLFAKVEHPSPEETAFYEAHWPALKDETNFGPEIYPANPGAPDEPAPLEGFASNGEEHPGIANPEGRNLEAV